MPVLRNTSRNPRTRVAQLIAVGLLHFSAGLTSPVQAAVISWNAGDGSWNNAANWSPNSIPDHHDFVRIGNLAGVQNSTVTLIGGGLLDFLEITDGMTLDVFDTELVTFEDIWILDANSRLIARPTLGPNFHDLQGILHVGADAHLQLVDNVPVRIFSGSESAGTISGRGEIQILSAPPFTNDGIIDPDGNGGIVLTAPTNSIDLDGIFGNGHLLLNTPFSELEVNTSVLSDSFSGTISMVPGALLTMNLADGWSTDANSSINVAGTDNPAAASQIAGSELTVGGMLNVGGAQGRLSVLAPATFAQNAVVNVGDADSLELSGQTTILGGQFAVGQNAEFGFYDDAVMRGGVFTTVSNGINDGFVAFNGATEWDGNVTINGAARQNGDAIVTGDTVIDAGLFDMDGVAGDTTWDVQASTVINATSIESNVIHAFDGTLNVGAGFLGQLTVNIDDPAPQWTMAGEMNLDGVAAAAFFVNRVGGSHLRISGELNISHRVRVTSDATFGDKSVTSFDDPASALQVAGQTLVSSDATFDGPGMLDNGATGELTLAGGAALDQVGLVNRGLLKVGNSPGVAAVDRFENMAIGSWLVDFGGYDLGDEYDHLLVTGGAASLDGLLQVSLTDDGDGLFLPQIGDEFTILTAVGGVTGQFLNDPVSAAGGMLFHWSVIYNPFDVILELVDVTPTVPEPVTFHMAMLAVVAMVRLRTSQRT